MLSIAASIKLAPTVLAVLNLNLKPRQRALSRVVVSAANRRFIKSAIYRNDDADEHRYREVGLIFADCFFKMPDVATNPFEVRIDIQCQSKTF